MRTPSVSRTSLLRRRRVTTHRAGRLPIAFTTADQRHGPTQHSNTVRSVNSSEARSTCWGWIGRRSGSPGTCRTGTAGSRCLIDIYTRKFVTDRSTGSAAPEQQCYCETCGLQNGIICSKFKGTNLHVTSSGPCQDHNISTQSRMRDARLITLLAVLAELWTSPLIELSMQKNHTCTRSCSQWHLAYTACISSTAPDAAAREIRVPLVEVPHHDLLCMRHTCCIQLSRSDASLLATGPIGTLTQQAELSATR